MNNYFMEYLMSPFREDEETLRIKKYTEMLSGLDDFKDLKIYFIQYNNINSFKRKLKLVDFYEQAKGKLLAITGAFFTPYTMGEYNTTKKIIYIYVDNLIKRRKYKICSSFRVKKRDDVFNTTCSDILRDMYHEKRHYLQDTTKDNSFESIMCQIELPMKKKIDGAIKYFKHHDEWYCEIDANRYGVEKAIQYYDNNPGDTFANMEFLDYYRRQYMLQDIVYDFDLVFTAYNNYREKMPFYDKGKKKLSDIFLLNKDMIWHKLLYGDKKRLRNVEDIVNDPLIMEVNPRFINCVLTSRYLNRDINYNDLSNNAAIILYKAFQCRYLAIHNILGDDLELLRIEKLRNIRDDLVYFTKRMNALNPKMVDINQKRLLDDLSIIDVFIDNKLITAKGKKK